MDGVCPAEDHWPPWLAARRPGAWEPVHAGESGAVVLRSSDGARYAKCVTVERSAELAAERDRVRWLAEQGIRAPEVLDWLADDAGAGLVTSAVRGTPANQLSATALRAAWPSIVDAVRTLHALPVTGCPFRRDLARMFARASDVVARGRVHQEFLPVEQQHDAPEELLARLAGRLDRMLAAEAADTVVCHGDLCLPNIVLGGDPPAFAGFVDLGRLGLADRHADISLLLTTAREIWSDESAAVAADAEFVGCYGRVPDAERFRYYLHLDPLTWG